MTSFRGLFYHFICAEHSAQNCQELMMARVQINVCFALKLHFTMQVSIVHQEIFLYLSSPLFFLCAPKGHLLDFQVQGPSANMIAVITFNFATAHKKEKCFIFSRTVDEVCCFHQCCACMAELSRSHSHTGWQSKYQDKFSWMIQILFFSVNQRLIESLSWANASTGDFTHHQLLREAEV